MANRIGSTLLKAASAAAMALLLELPGAAAQTAVPMATWGGENHVINLGFVPALEKALEEIAPGKFTLQNFPNGQLATDKDMPIGIPTGKVKFGLLTVNGWSGTVRDVKAFDAPTGLTMSELDEVMHKKGLLKILQTSFTEKRAILLGVADLGPPALVSKKKIVSPTDLEGVKVRVFSEGQADTLRAFGGIPVTIAFAEIYTALQHGTVDAALVGFQGIESAKLYEVTSFTLLPASFFGTTMMGWAANPQWLQSIPASDRPAFEQAVSKAASNARAAIVEEIGKLTAHYESKKMTVTALDPAMPEYEQWIEATKPMAAKAKAEISPKAVELIFGR